MTSADTLVRRIDLDPTDWYLATWRNLPPLPRPAPAPFDQAACSARIQQLKHGRSGGWTWHEAGVPTSMSPQEAHFWFEAMTSVTSSTRASTLGSRLAKAEFTVPPDRPAIIARLRENYQAVPAEVVLPLVHLRSTQDLVDLILGDALGIGTRFTPSSMTNDQLNQVLAKGFRRYVAPWLSVLERAALRGRVLPLLDPAAHAQTTWTLPAAWTLAACLGMHDSVLDLVRRWSDGLLHSRIAYRQQDAWFILFGLGSVELLREQADRLKASFDKPEQIRGWLAHTDVNALERITESIRAQTARERAEELLDALALVQAPETAEQMLRLTLHGKAVTVARRWLDEHLPLALPSLILVAAGRGALAEAALAYVREMQRKGHTAEFEKALAEAPESIATRISKAVLESATPIHPPFHEASTPDWLRDGLATVKVGKLPEWADLALLPPIVVGSNCLTSAQVAGIVRALQESTPEKPAPVLTALKAQGERGSLDQFAWAVFERWQVAGGPSKDRWGLQVLGLLGGDGCALKLTPLLREWPGQSQHKRAVTGLECLRAIGSETALMQLSMIADKVKFSGIKKRAQEFMQAIATERGLSQDQLEDRIVPTLDLDERGNRIFDFGPRRFRMALGPDLKPMIREEGGKLRADLPKPTKADDAIRAAEAANAWKLLKKQLREVLKLQSSRLEKAMLDHRRWSAGEFETLLIRHPVMSHLSRLVLWGTFGPSGAVEQAFRVTEDRTFADLNDNPVTLEEHALIGLVHPLHLTPEQRERWGQVFGDYELVAPFPQLARRVFVLDAKEAQGKVIERFRGQEVKGPALVYGIPQRGWVPCEWNGGKHTGSICAFPKAGVSAVATWSPGLDGLYYYGSGSTAENQTLDTIYFVEGIRAPGEKPTPEEAVVLGTVDALAMSEVLGLFTSLAERGV